MASDERWPAAPPRATEYGKLKYAAQLAERQAKVEHAHQLELKQLDSDVALQKETWLTEHKLHSTYHEALTDVAKGGLERVRDSAKYVETAAAAILATYTGVLGLVFVVKDRPLPARGVIPGLFLGLAIAFAAVYLGYVSRPAVVGPRPPGSTLRDTQELRSTYFIQWVHAAGLARAWAMRAAVSSLVAAAVFLPAPFVTVDPPTWLVTGSGNSAAAASQANAAGAESTQPATATDAGSAATEPPRPDETIEDAPSRRMLYAVELELYKQQRLAALTAANAAGRAPTSPTPARDLGWLWALGAAAAFLLVLLAAFLPEMGRAMGVLSSKIGERPGPLHDPR